MEFLSNHPFENMPITNGCFLSSLVPSLFAVFTGETLLYGIWFVCFNFSIIADQYVNNYSKRA